MRIPSILTALGIAACLLSCGKAVPGDGTVRFRLSYGNTRAAFSGEIGADGVERIDWEKGDRIRIASPQAHRADGDERPFADYRVETVRTDGSSSFATVTPDGPSGLCWGEGEHSFHAVNPAPEEEDIDLADSLFQGRIPAGQVLSWDGGEGRPDPHLLTLLASAEGVKTEETVSLAFRPAFTAVSFSISLDDANPVPISSFRLESSGGPLAGSFRTGWTGNAVPEAGEDASAVISVALDRTIEKGRPITFTVICLPLALSGLKAVFETGYGTKSLTLSYSDGTPVTFPACSKARITGLVLPGAPDIAFSIIGLEPWEEAREEAEAGDLLTE